MMTCPYCKELMKCGKIYSFGQRAIYWLPADHEPDEVNVIYGSIKSLQKLGGIAIDQPSHIMGPSIVKKRPDSYYCANCQLFMIRNKPSETEPTDEN